MTDPAQDVRASALAGAWFLHAASHGEAGRAAWGDKPDGMLIYGPDGRMTALAGAAFGVAGRFRTAGHAVDHEVELSSGSWPRPGSRLQAIRQGDALRMELPPADGGPVLLLVWRRSPPAWSAFGAGLAELAPTRRVVTANDAAGRSFIAEDGPSPAMMTVAARPGYRSNNIWRTVGGPTRVEAPDTVGEQRGVMPPAGGTVLRVIDYPPRPDDPEERRRQATASLRALFPDAAHEHAAEQAGMHRTRSVDYAVVLSGSITSVQDGGEVELSTGDILVQRGTNHAWENRSGRMARVAYILVDGY